MTISPLLVFAIGALALMKKQQHSDASTSDTSTTTTPQQAAMRELIARTADRLGVPRKAALAFAWLESRFNPRAEGDLKWHERKGGELYRKLVLESPRLKDNPARLEPEAWHSYGLFQMLAPHHVPAHMHPRELLSPELNAELGVRFIKGCLKRTGGDVEAARLLYAGCGADGKLCSVERATEIRTRLAEALRKFEGA